MGHAMTLAGPLAVALILLGANTSAYTMDMDRTEAPREELFSGNDGGGYSNPWAGGSWTMTAEGLDPTMGYDDLTKLRNNELLHPQSPPEVLSTAETLVDYQQGWVDADVWVKTRALKGSGDVRIGKATITPGAGWFIAADRPLDTTTVVPTSQWVRVAGEDVRVTVQASSLLCPSVTDVSIFGDPSTHGEFSFLTRLAPHQREINDHIDLAPASPSFFRNDVLEIEVYGPRATLIDCTYTVSYDVHLTFAFEAYVAPPGTRTVNEQPTADVYQNETDLEVNADVYDFGTYEYDATLSVTKGDPGGGTEPQARVDASPVTIRMLYAPVLPLLWVCQTAPVVEDDCVGSVLSSTPHQGISVVAASVTDEQGIILVGAERFNDRGLAVVHHVDIQQDLIDTSRSLLYSLDVDVLTSQPLA